MSQSFEIRYLATAVRDMEDVFDYISKDRPAAAVSLLENLTKPFRNWPIIRNWGWFPKTTV